MSDPQKKKVNFDFLFSRKKKQQKNLLKPFPPFLYRMLSQRASHLFSFPATWCLKQMSLYHMCRLVSWEVFVKAFSSWSLWCWNCFSNKRFALTNHVIYVPCYCWFKQYPQVCIDENSMSFLLKCYLICSVRFEWIVCRMWHISRQQLQHPQCPNWPRFAPFWEEYKLYLWLRLIDFVQEWEFGLEKILKAYLNAVQNSSSCLCLLRTPWIQRGSPVYLHPC